MSSSVPCIYNIFDFGAKSDGTTNNATAIQTAIETCHQAGGGTVLCPPGTYRTGSIRIRSNVELHLTAGAKLLASEERRDYQTFHRGVTGFHADAPMLNYVPEHLVFAENESNVSITGMGEIDGNGRAFYDSIPPGEKFHAVKNGWRPIQLVAFANCRNIRLQGVTFRDSPGWMIWPIGCDGVHISGIKIHNNPQGPNTDGIDVDTCRNVRISDCLIEAGDDCIALKSDKSKKPVLDACEYITVTNCVLQTTCCAVRVGYEGDHPIRHCAFSNLVIKQTRTGLNMLVPQDTFHGIFQGPAIEDIRFSDILMDTVIPFYLWTGPDIQAPSGIRGIRFHNITATTERGCYFGGNRANPIEDLFFSNIDLSVRGPMDSEFAKEVPDPYQVWDYFNKRGIPHALFFRNVKGIRLNDVRVDWKKAEGAWLSALRTESVEDLSIHGFSETGKPKA